MPRTPQPVIIVEPSRSIRDLLRPVDLNDIFQRPYGTLAPAKPVAFDAQRKTPRRHRGGEMVLRPLRPNVGLQTAYRQRLDALIQAMNDSVLYWIRARFKSDPPRMAADARLPANALQGAIRALAKQWEDNFDEAAPALAEWFARSSRRQTDASLRAILKKGGFSVEFKLTPASRDILKATIFENVNLIKSIPAQYLTQVEGMVMRSVQVGRDLGSLTKELEEQFGVTRRRAAFIARDQNNKATASIQRARHQELGLSRAIWMHSGGGKRPRESHVANNGKEYDIAKGWYDPHERVWTWPGILPNCRCVSRAIIPGFT